MSDELLRIDFKIVAMTMILFIGVLLINCIMLYLLDNIYRKEDED